MLFVEQDTVSRDYASSGNGLNQILRMESLIHSKALVDANAQIGNGTSVGPFAVIEAEAVIGEGCSIGTRVVIKRYTTVGNENRIADGAILGGPPQDLNYKEERSFLKIGDRNNFGEGATAHRSARPDGSTIIGSDNRLMSYAHVAHDCLLGDEVVVGNHVALAGHVHIESGASISSGAVVHQFCRVGRNSRVGLNCKVQQDILPFCVVEDVPGRVRGLNRESLEQAGVSDADLATLERALHILSQRNLRLSEKLAALADLESQQVAHLVSFIEKSQRGFCPMLLPKKE